VTITNDPRSWTGEQRAFVRSFLGPVWATLSRETTLIWGPIREDVLGGGAYTFAAPLLVPCPRLSWVSITLTAPAFVLFGDDNVVAPADPTLCPILPAGHFDRIVPPTGRAVSIRALDPNVDGIASVIGASMGRVGHEDRW
jgi:hypothetical protein